MKKKSIEQLYFEFLEEGLSRLEIDNRINTVLFHRTMDEVSPSEALIRHSMRFEAMAESGYYDEDLFGDDLFDSIETNLKEAEQLSELPSYTDLVDSVGEMRKQMNDILIDKHLYEVVLKHNLDEDNDNGIDDSQDKGSKGKGKGKKNMKEEKGE